MSALIILAISIYVSKQRTNTDATKESSSWLHEVNANGSIERKTYGISENTPEIPFNPSSEATGVASWYGKEVCIGRSKCLMANGEVFNENSFTTACSSIFLLGTRLRFTYKGLTKEAVCTDRGSFESMGRIFDFSRALFAYFAPLDKGIITIGYEVLDY